MEWEGGMKHYFESVYKAVSQEKDIKMKIFILKDPIRNKKEEIGEIPADSSKIKISWKNSNNIGRLLEKIFTGRVDKCLLNFIEEFDPDLIHIIWDNYFINNIKQISKKYKVLYTVHDVFPHERAYRNFGEYIFHKFQRIREKKKINQAKFLFTNSLHQKKYLEMKYKNKKVFYANMPSTLTEIIKNGGKIPEEIKNERGYILFFGRIQKYKGIEYLVEAYERSSFLPNNFKLVIAGYGQIYWKTEFSPNVIFINRFIEDEEIRELFTRAKIVVFPYISATQAGPPAIAHYFQVPLIVSNVDGLKEFVENEVTGLIFEPKNATDLKHKMELLVSDPILYENIKANQKKYYEEFYSLEALGKSLCNIYNRII